MNTYQIFRVETDGGHNNVTNVSAPNGKLALKKFLKEHLTSAGMYEILKIKDGTWELFSTYGGYWYAVKV